MPSAGKQNPTKLDTWEGREAKEKASMKTHGGQGWGQTVPYRLPAFGHFAACSRAHIINNLL